MQEGAGKYDLPDRSEISAAMERIISVAFMFLAMFGNTLIIAAYYRNKVLRTTPNLLVVNLTIVDTLAAITTHPLLVSVLISGGWFFGPDVCKYQAILNSFFFIISHLSITFLSLNRYFIIVRYKKHTATFVKRSTRIFLMSIWIISCCFGVSHLMANEKFEFHAKEAVCIISRENSTTSVLMAAFGNIVFIATVYLNLAIFKSVRLHRRQVSITLNKNPSGTDHREPGSSGSRRKRSKITIGNEELSIARKVVIVTSLYTLCWLPQGITKTARLGNTDFSREIWMASTFSTQLSSVVNPVLFGLFNKKFRRAIIEMLRIQNRRNVIHDTVFATDSHNTGIVGPLRLQQPFTVQGCLAEETTL